mmetsp:Transcript_103698/g.298011  ORF Transcript_103698/g.298011 Transcript_103698/m.298011 type:complete len:178 (-) Transcript_103698:2482-3015(-)
MVAAEEDGLSDASAETVEQHPDCRGEADEGGNEDTDGDGSGGGGGGSGESEHDDSESDTDDGGAEDHPAVVVTRNACGEGTLTVVSVALASRSGKAPSKTRKYVYLRDLEYHLDGTAGRSTSRLPKKLGIMGVSDTLRVVEAKSVRDGEVTEEEWTALLSAYMHMVRSRDALATTGT